MLLLALDAAGYLFAQLEVWAVLVLLAMVLRVVVLPLVIVDLVP